MRIALISCTKLKETKPCVAANMYLPSPLFKKARKYVGAHYNRWYILSAEYGLLMPTHWVHPYDKTLNNMLADSIKEWSEMVFTDILSIRPTEVDFYAGERYRKYLIPLLEAESIKCNVPLKGMGIGEQLSWYKSKEESE
jgi:hypothetical protein